MHIYYKFFLKIVATILLFSFYSCEKIKNKNNKVLSDSAMVSSAHSLSSKVGINILKQGGNAFDAAVAIQFTLSVVYPNAGNIGGGGFVVYRLNNGEIGSLDFREKAPFLSSKNMYLYKKNDSILINYELKNHDVDEMIVDVNKSKIGHLASGIPGTVDGMIKLHEKFGILDWENLLNPSIKLAREGFQLTTSQSNSLNSTKDLFIKVNKKPIPFVKNNGWKTNDTLVQNDLSLTLNRIKNQKRDGFYSGITAKLLLKEMNKGNGIFTQDDLDKYSSIWRKPIVGYYKNHKIISMGPPSSGGIALVQLLKGIENYNIKNYGFNSLKTINLMTELESRVYADRATHLGDPDFYKVPVEELINSNYLENKFKNINPLKKTPSNEIKEGFITYNESDETTHFSIVDKFGNAVSITTTLNGSYGSKVIVDGAGFLLNNEMDDFSVKPGFPNMFGLIGGKANSIEPGKRMLSSMTPTIIEKNNNLFMVLGTPGGSTIITSVFQTILNVIDYGMTMQEAVDAKKIHHQWVPDILYIEKNSINNETKEQLISIGHKINERGSIGRMNCILINSDNKLEGGSDKRGDNIAIGY
tara:strand:- start:215 stop:1969 length:1755 start_codon:yes stop_codon:yes gene_type:complete